MLIRGVQRASRLAWRRAASQRPLSSAASSPAPSAAVVPPGAADVSTLASLERSLERRDPAAALQHFDALTSPPGAQQQTRLALLLAKNADAGAFASRAHELLKSVYMLPSLQADDLTKLASIYVVDACLRHKMVEQAVEVYEEALNAGVVLDLPAYDALLQALVDAGRVDDAATILKEIVAQKDVSPTETSFAPLLLALMERFEYTELVNLIDHGRTHGVSFTLDAYDPLVELGELQQENPDCIDGLEKFMVYVNQALEEDGLMSELEDDDDEDNIEVAFVSGGDPDDDDDDEFGEHDDDEFN